MGGRELDPGTGPKTRSSTSSATSASTAPPSPAISLIETPPECPVKFASGPGGEALPVKDYSSGDDSDRRERRQKRGERERDEDAVEEDEWEENDGEDPTQGKEG